ncbi:MAG TPA: zinc ribbon domain-containing protein [Pseudolysinimonas sp.]|nr:zinc ribbon domain-containing protein [Pseudolysinimonas sp.]
MTDLRAAARPDPDSQPFWDACQRRELVGQRCGACGVWRWPPRAHCSVCHERQPLWEPLFGTGTILGVVTVRRALDPAFAHTLPLPIIHVGIDGTDGAMVLTSNLLPGQWPQAEVGKPVSVRFARVRSDLILPLFTIDYKKGGVTND